MDRLVIAAVVLALAQVPGQPGASDTNVTRLAVSTAESILILDVKTLGGTPTRLAWSPDGRQLYVRGSRFDRWSNETVTHLVVSIDPRQASSVVREPLWAARYWSWKSAPAAPGRDDFAIKVETRDELVRTTNVPREGNIGMHAADPNAGLDEVVRNAALSSQKTFFEILTVRGQTIDRAVNRHTVPGRMFGWAPAPCALLVYADEKGRLVIMDSRGRTRQVKKTKDVLLPAWSEDGMRIAFVQKAGRELFDVRVIAIS